MQNIAGIKPFALNGNVLSDVPSDSVCFFFLPSRTVYFNYPLQRKQLYSTRASGGGLTTAIKPTEGRRKDTFSVLGGQNN